MTFGAIAIAPANAHDIGASWRHPIRRFGL